MDIIAFDNRGHFMKCAWRKAKLIGMTAWKSYLVEFEDGYRTYTNEVKDAAHDTK